MKRPRSELRCAVETVGYVALMIALMFALGWLKTLDMKWKAGIVAKAIAEQIEKKRTESK